jgi:hypothetical protein
MPELTRRERILAAGHRQRADRLPFFHYWRHSQVGWAERACRNRGMGMNWVRPPYVEKLHGVEISERRVAAALGFSAVQRTYTTPVGSVWLEEWTEPGVGEWHARRSWRGQTPHLKERLIKGPEDYAVVRWMVEHTEYVADFFPVEQALDWLGEDGVVLSGLPHSPMNMLALHWVGVEDGRLYYHMADYPDLVQELYAATCKAREPMYEIAARSPAPIVLCGDNIDSVLASPRLFRNYMMPVYRQMADVLHVHDKLLAVHMDGRLRALKALIAESAVDIVEAFHPPPLGDLPIGEALAAWPDKAIWVGFPGPVYAQGPEATRQYALDLLAQIDTGDRVAIAMSTENQIANENLLALTAVLEQAELPLR